MKPQLLLVHDAFDFRGGGEQMLLRVARAASEDFDLSLALLWADSTGVLNREELSLFRKIRCFRFPYGLSLSSMPAHLRQMSELRGFLREENINGTLSFSLRPALRIADAAGRSIPGAWMCQQSFPLFEKPFAALKQTLGLRVFRRAGTRIVTISGEGSRQMKQLLPGEPFLIRNGIDVEKFASAYDARIDSGEAEMLRILCIARLDPIKNHPVLLRACGLLRQRGIPFRITLAGGAVPHAADWPEHLRALSAELGIADCIQWPGECTDIRPLLADADVAVLPSRKEAMGLVLAEAGAARLPLIGSRVGGIPEVVRNGVNGITFANDDEQELAAALESLHGNPGLRKQYGDAAFQMVQAEFNAERQNALWRTFLHQLVRGSNVEIPCIISSGATAVP